MYFCAKKEQMKNLFSFYKLNYWYLFTSFSILFLLHLSANAQKLEYWTTNNGNLIYEEFLVGRDLDYFTITLRVRYRGNLETKYQLVSQRKIKSPSPQDCKVLQLAADTVYVAANAPADLVTYKIKRGVSLLYLRPVYEPAKQWRVQEVQ